MQTPATLHFAPQMFGRCAIRMGRRFIAATLVVAGLCSPAAAVAASAQGVVFEDTNRNGTLDAGEPGIANVAVSNGEAVELTDSRGRYRLPVGEDTIIFVVKPSGFEFPTDRNKLPRFYYIHKPQGSPRFRYAGVPPTGDLPSSIDFPLQKVESSDRFDVLLFADPQPNGVAQIDFLNRDIVAESSGTTGYRFGITLGDIVQDNLDLSEPLNAVISRIGIPWFNVPGNHDLNLDAEDPEFSDETYERIYGPSTYALNEGKVHFILLNNVVYPNRRNEARGHGPYVGGFSDRQLRFVENSLRHVPKDHLVVLGMHIPLIDGGQPDYSPTIPGDRKRLLDLLRDRPNTLSLSGHAHMNTNWFLDGASGWRGAKPHHHYTVGAASGDWWRGTKDDMGLPDATMRDGTPNGYAILHVDGSSYSLDYKAARQAPDHRMSIYGPKVAAPGGRSYYAEFYVNYFMGSERTTVEYRTPDGTWRRMERTLEIDPTLAGVRYQWDSSETFPSGYHPSPPQPCFHLWKARVPTTMEPGRQGLIIRVTEPDGRQFSSVYSFTLLPRKI